MCEYYVEELNFDSVKHLLPQRSSDSNKGTYGKVLNIAGSMNYQGAAYLSSVSALKVGAGLVSLAAIESVINNISALTPNLTFFHLRDSYKKCVASDSFSELKPVLDSYNVISAGSGLSDSAAVQAFVCEAVKYFNALQTPVVLDADALNAISVSDIERLPQNSVITPHPKELSRLLNITVDEIQADRLSAARAASEKYGCITVLKGHRTVICTKDFRLFVNTTGNSALAKAGSGDVLTGMISGFIAQKLCCEDAAKLAVFLHGLSGEIASEEFTQYSVLAQDLIDKIPDAIRKILV